MENFPKTILYGIPTSSTSAYPPAVWLKYWSLKIPWSLKFGAWSLFSLAQPDTHRRTSADIG
jgi:hypothetical protein